MKANLDGIAYNKSYLEVMIAIEGRTPTEEQPRGWLLYVKFYKETRNNSTHPLYPGRSKNWFRDETKLTSVRTRPRTDNTAQSHRREFRNISRPWSRLSPTKRYIIGVASYNPVHYLLNNQHV